jgi:hypothetical protein
MGGTRKTRQNLKMDNKGKAGCGCLIGILIIIMIFAGLGFHPVSLKTFAKVFRYGDPVVTADAVFVPGFPEDKNGELYVDAFREYFAGNGRVIYAENEKMPGKDMGNILNEMARARGVREKIVKTISTGGTEDKDRPSVVTNKLRSAGVKKVIVIVPEYASRRYHLMYSRDTSGVLYMIKPLKVSYFQSDRWWRDDISRGLMAREAYYSLKYCFEFLKEKFGK